MKKNTIFKFTLITYLSVLLISCGEFVGFDDLGDPDTGNIKKIRLYFSADGIEKLYNSVVDDYYYTHCLYSENRSGAVDCRIKIRGDSSRAYPKKSYTIKFEGTDGEIKYALIASFKDPSSIRNRTAMYAYSLAGLPSPESEGAALFINDSYIGYYTKMELYSEEKLKKLYGNCELYKCKFDSVGNDFPLRSFSEKEFPDNNDFSSLDRLVSFAKNMSGDEWNSFVADNFHIEETARYLFIHSYLAVTDTTQKNFNILYNGKYLILPWDNEASLGRKYTGAEYDTSLYKYEGDSLLNRRLLQAGSPVRARYIELLEAAVLADGIPTPDPGSYKVRLKAVASDYAAEIDRAVYYDSNRFHSYGEFISETSAGGFIDQFLDNRSSDIPLLD